MLKGRFRDERVRAQLGEQRRAAAVVVEQCRRSQCARDIPIVPENRGWFKQNESKTMTQVYDIKRLVTTLAEKIAGD
jgi:hypothetical protein